MTEKGMAGIHGTIALDRAERVQNALHVTPVQSAN